MRFLRNTNPQAVNVSNANDDGSGTAVIEDDVKPPERPAAKLSMSTATVGDAIKKSVGLVGALVEVRILSVLMSRLVKPALT